MMVTYVTHLVFHQYNYVLLYTEVKLKISSGREKLSKPIKVKSPLVLRGMVGDL